MGHPWEPARVRHVLSRTKLPLWLRGKRKMSLLSKYPAAAVVQPACNPPGASAAPGALATADPATHAGNSAPNAATHGELPVMTGKGNGRRWQCNFELAFQWG